MIKKTLCGIFTLSVLILLHSCTGSTDRTASDTVTVSETCRPQDILPMLAVLDASYDTTSLAAYTRSRNSLLDQASDTLKFNIYAYLKKGIKMSLFKKFLPNMRRDKSPDFPPFEETSYIGFCPDSDTTAVNDILLQSGLFKTGLSYRWIPFNYIGSTFYYYKIDPDKYAVLIVSKPPARIVNLPSNAFKAINVTKNKATTLHQLIDQWRGRYQLHIIPTLTRDADSTIRAAFSEDAVVLVKYHYQDHDYYYSGAVDDLSRKIAFGNTGG
jgi:hypothetical protein